MTRSLRLVLVLISLLIPGVLPAVAGWHSAAGSAEFDLGDAPRQLAGLEAAGDAMLEERVLRAIEPSGYLMRSYAAGGARALAYVAFYTGFDSTKINTLVTAYEHGELESLPGRSLEETLEMEIMRVTGRARDMAGEIASKYLGLDNSAVIMAKSGARGSMLNLSQMSGCVGQQAVRGERISRGYKYRTLPHFKKGDLGASAKGFVANSYKSGLNPTEYFFHSMGGREGLVDTAVRTSRSGYMQRRLVNALEDLKVESDGTVRHTGGEIIQFRYGDDGARLRRLVADLSLDKEMLQEVIRKKL